MLPFRVVVAGSRTIRDKAMIFHHLDKILERKLQTHQVTIISGCAAGPDSIGVEWALDHNVPFIKRPANWKELGRSAGYIRNMIMLESCHAVIAFHDGKSRGTAHMIKITREAKKPLRVITMEEGHAVK